jgi:competence protein ComGC
MHKKSFTLLEIIFSIVIISVVVISALNMMNILNTKNNNTYKTTVTKIDIEATRLFLENKTSTDKKLDKLLYKKKKLYYDNGLLLNNISSFSKTLHPNNTEINFCITIDKEFCTKMVF